MRDGAAGRLYSSAVRPFFDFVDRFLPDGVEGEERRRARAVVAMALLTAPWGLLIGGMLVWMGEAISGAEIVAVAVVCVLLLPLVRRGSIQLAAHLLVLTLVQALVVSAILLGGVGSPPTQWLVLGPVIATATAGPRAGLQWTGGVIVAALAIHGAQAAGMVAVPYLFGGWEYVGTVSLLGLYLLMGVFLFANDGLYRRLVDRLQRAEAAERAANRAKSAFLANMSHEIRTPLNAILGYTELVTEELEEREESAIVDDLGRVARSGNHLLELVNDILDLSKIEAGRLELATEVVALEPLVASTVDTLTPLLAARSNGVVVEGAAANVRADPTRLQQCLTNLVANAAKFTESGTITVRIHTDGVEVQDTGIGMTEEQLARVFDPFSQAEADTARRFGGTGLGLAIVERLVRQMEGAIEVESQPSVGSRFRIRLPPG